MKKRIALITAGITLAVSGVAQAHGLGIAIAEISKTSSNTIERAGEYRIPSVHNKVSVRTCTWYRPSGGSWGALLNTCETKTLEKQNRVRDVSGWSFEDSWCNGHLKTRARGWATGDSGTEHSEDTDESNPVAC